jgi:hypothetical protein
MLDAIGVMIYGFRLIHRVWRSVSRANAAQKHSERCGKDSKGLDNSLGGGKKILNGFTRNTDVHMLLTAVRASMRRQ